MRTYFSKTNHGFTLIETLIAVTLLSIAFVGVITVATQGGVNIKAAKNKITANLLASEGIEMMRAERDNNILLDPVNGWHTFFHDALNNCTDGCDIDVTDTDSHPGFEFYPCPDPCQLLYETDPNTDNAGTYNLFFGNPSNFSRKIVVFAPGPDEIMVSSTVSWMDGSLPQSITAEESVFNWIQ